MSVVGVSLAVDGGHDHGLSFGPDIGPLVLRVALLGAVLVVSSFGFLRGFLAEQGRRTTLAVIGSAATGVLMELLLSGGLNLPQQVVPLLLAGLALPMYLVLSTDQRFAPAVARLRRLAPWVFVLTGSLALAEFARAWFTRTAPATSPQTGVVFALLALAWYAIVRTPRRRAATLGVTTAAAGLAVVLLACAANVVAQSLPEPAEKAAVAVTDPSASFRAG